MCVWSTHWNYHIELALPSLLTRLSYQQQIRKDIYMTSVSSLRVLVAHHVVVEQCAGVAQVDPRHWSKEVNVGVGLEHLRRGW